MSLDYPNRKDWLRIRHTDRKAMRDRIVGYVVQVPAGGSTKDPGMRDSRKLNGRQRSMGAGSINAEAHMMQLIEAGKPDEAAALFELHHRIKGATPMRRGRAWYELYKAGDERARGVAA